MRTTKIIKTRKRSLGRVDIQEIRESERDSWFAGYAKKNPLKLLTAIITFFGLSTIYAYQFHIDYSAQFDVQSSAGLISSVACAGFLLLGICGTVIFMPAYFIGAFCLDAKSPIQGGNRGATLFVFFALAWAVFVGLVTLVFVCAANDWNGAYIPLLFPLALLSYLLYKRVFDGADLSIEASAQSNPGWLKRQWLILSQMSEEKRRILIFSLSMALVSFLQFLPLMMYFLMLRDSPDLRGDQIDWVAVLPRVGLVGMLIQAISVYLVQSWTGSTLSSSHKPASLCCAFFAPIIISIFGGNGAFFWCAIAHTTKIGNFLTKEMTVTKLGCSIISEQGGEDMCGKASSSGTYKICGAYIMSRPGSETYLKLRFPGSHLISASLREVRKEGKGKANSNKANEVTDIQDIYVPSKEILGMKEDDSIRFFNAAAVNPGLEKFIPTCDSSAK